jgi:hypothetical protein
MRLRSLLFALAVTLGGCWEMPPGNVPLSSEAENVEIVSEAPSPEIYESFQELSVQAIGLSSLEATNAAKHMLRNRGAELHARFVSVDDSTASLAWDFSGRTIVTLRGRAFRVKEEAPPTPARSFERVLPVTAPPPASLDASAPAPEAPDAAASAPAVDAAAPATPVPSAKPAPKTPAAAAKPAVAPKASASARPAPQSPMGP